MSSGILDIIKRASLDAVENNKPSDLRFGTVISTSPLKVQVTNQFVIPESLLIVPEKLTSYQISVTMDWSTTPYTHTHTIDDTYTGGGSASSDTHTHSTVGTKSITIHNELKVGDKVALMRKAGGQSYFILDRIAK